MPTQKWCSVVGCKNFIFATLDDLAEHDWSAFQIPNGCGKVKCFCPEHQEEMKKQMKTSLEKYASTNKNELNRSEGE